MVKRLVERAQHNPGVCVITNAGEGPLVDTGIDYQDRRGRIYVSLKGMAEFFRADGWEDPDTVSRLRRTVAAQDQEIAEIEARIKRLEALEEAVQGLMEPRVEEVEKVVQVEREPTEDEVERWVTNHPQHPVVLGFVQPDAGSTEEWFRMYGGKNTDEKTRNKKRAAMQKQIDSATSSDKAIRQQREEGSERKGEMDVTAPPAAVELNGSTVDLDDLLDKKVKDVLAFIDGHPTEFQLHVLAREEFRAKEADKKPRKMIADAVNEHLDSLNA